MSDSRQQSTYASNALTMQYGVVAGGSFTTHNIGRQYIHQLSGPREGLQLLKQKVSSTAFHNSSARFDPPKCHENTRVAVLRKIMDWIMNRDLDTRDKLIMWLNGAAGAGKSAIMQTLAELCDQQGYLLASFFFGRLDPTRNHVGSLMATIVYQIFTYIQEAQEDILYIIENDPLIFDRNVITQLTALLCQPLERLVQGNYFKDPNCRRLIIIDGLDECNSRDSQREVIAALFQAVNQLRLPIRFIVASRLEADITTSFNSENSGILGCIPLDNNYHNDDDIAYFLREEFRRIRQTHLHKHLLPETWPDDSTIRTLVSKSSGQFIYAATAVKYVKSPRKRPDHRLEIIQGLRPRANDMDMPFAELDALYTHILSSSEDITLVLDILRFVLNVRGPIGNVYLSDFEFLLELDPGSIETLLCDLGSLVEIVDIKEGRTIKILHASFQDFLGDAARSKTYFRDPTKIIRDQLKQCFRVMSKCSSKLSVNNSELDVAGRLFLYLANKIDCDLELATMLSGPSAVRLMRLPTLTDDSYKFYVGVFVPGILHFLKRSGMILAYATLQMALDEEYRIMIEPYYTDTTLSFILAIVSHTGRITSAGLIERICAVRRNEDALSLSSNFQYFVESIIPQNELIAGFLRNPERSKEYCLQSSGGRLHSNAIIQCLRFLSNSELPSYLHPIADKTVEVFQSYDNRDGEILSKPNPEDIHESRLTEGDANTNNNFDLSRYLESLQTCYEDGSNIDDGFTMGDVWEHCNSVRYHITRKSGMGSSIQRSPKYEYLVLLGYILYFFPRAGRCDTLLHLCKTRALLSYTDLFDVHRENLLRAMDAYVARWSETSESARPSTESSDEWAYPYPLVKTRVSMFTNAEKEAVLRLRALSSL